MKPSILSAAVLGALLLTGASIRAQSPATTVVVYSAEPIQCADTAYKQVSPGVTVAENGRVIIRTLELPSFDDPARIIGRLTIIPVPKDELDVCDKWDRAGNIRLAQVNGPDIELIKFITAYGGHTEHEVDLSHLAPLLHGSCTIKGFIDTWVSPAWRISFDLVFERDTTQAPVKFVRGVLFEESATQANMTELGRMTRIEIPKGLKRVLLYYYASGHCTDGRDEDEFVPKDNVIRVDNRVVHRFRPWRDDCRKFREINPYTRRWSDGSWSSDYSRSGWCPGDVVKPLVLDLTDHLSAGKHTLSFMVENIRPVDTAGHYGYWRLSAQVVGY